jgi:hypothetical protein
MAIDNELGMKPMTERIMFSDKVHTLEDLMLTLKKVRMISNQHDSTVHTVDTWGNGVDIQLEAECLSDGSVVYNLHIGAEATQN